MVSSIKYFIEVIIIFYFYSDEVCTTDFGVVTDNEIKLLYNETGTTTIDVGLHYMSAAAYDATKKDIYVSDVTEKKIFRIKTNEVTEYVAEAIVARNDLYVNGMAFNHSTSTLYWTSYGGIFHFRVPDIEVKDPFTGDVWLKEEVANLHDITIDVDGKFLYWAKDGRESATILRSPLLDKPKPQELMKNLYDPRSITVDAKSNMLYWIEFYDDGSRSLHRMHLEKIGSGDTLIDDKENRSIFVIALDDHNVYWIDCQNSFNLWQKDKNWSKGNDSLTPVSAIQLKVRPIKLFSLSGDEKAGKEDSENKENVSGDGAESKTSEFLNHYNRHTQHSHN